MILQEERIRMVMMVGARLEDCEQRGENRYTLVNSSGETGWRQCARRYTNDKGGEG